MKTYKNELMHYGIKGQKHGRRRFQNEDGSLTAAGRARYGVSGAGSAGHGILSISGPNRVSSSSSRVSREIRDPEHGKRTTVKINDDGSQTAETRYRDKKAEKQNDGFARSTTRKDGSYQNVYRDSKGRIMLYDSKAGYTTQVKPERAEVIKNGKDLTDRKYGGGSRGYTESTADFYRDRGLFGKDHRTERKIARDDGSYYYESAKNGKNTGTKKVGRDGTKRYVTRNDDGSYVVRETGKNGETTKWQEYDRYGKPTRDFRRREADKKKQQDQESAKRREDDRRSYLSYAAARQSDKRWEESEKRAAQIRDEAKRAEADRRAGMSYAAAREADKRKQQKQEKASRSIASRQAAGLARVNKMIENIKAKNVSSAGKRKRQQRG